MAENVELDFNVDKVVSGLKTLIGELNKAGAAQNQLGDAAVDSYKEASKFTTTYAQKLGVVTKLTKTLADETDNYGDELAALVRLERQLKIEQKQANDPKSLNLLADKLNIVKQRMIEIKIAEKDLNNLQLDRTKKELDELNKKLGVTEKAASHAADELDNVDEAGSGGGGLLNFGTLAAGAAGLAIGAAAGVVTLSQQLVQTTSKFQGFQATLKNTFGSDLIATAQLDRLQEFAIKTPFQLDALTGSFIRLTNSGLAPTNADLTALGDLAASRGKSFEQLTDAVTDSVDDMVQRLKEFGISIDRNGTKATLRFATATGEVTKVVENNQKAIAKQVIEFGKLEGVTGGMAAQSKTLVGQISNLKDQFDALFNQPRLAGFFGDIIEGAANALSYIKDFIDTADFSAVIASGRIMYSVIRDIYINAIQPLAESLVNFLSPILRSLGRNLDETGEQASGFGQVLTILASPIYAIYRSLALLIDATSYLLDLFGLTDKKADEIARRNEQRARDEEKSRKERISNALNGAEQLAASQEETTFIINEYKETLSAIDAERQKLINGDKEQIVINGKLIQSYDQFGRSRILQANQEIAVETKKIQEKIKLEEDVQKALADIKKREADAAAAKAKEARDKASAEAKAAKDAAAKLEAEKNAKIYQLRVALLDALKQLEEKYNDAVDKTKQDEELLLAQRKTADKEIDILEKSLKEKAALLAVTQAIGAAKLKDISDEEMDRLVKEKATTIQLTKEANAELNKLRELNNDVYLRGQVEFLNKKRVIDAQINAVLNQGTLKDPNTTIANAILSANKRIELKIVTDAETAKLEATARGIRESYKLLKEGDTQTKRELEAQFNNIQDLIIKNSLSNLDAKFEIAKNDVQLSKEYYDEISGISIQGNIAINNADKERVQGKKDIIDNLLKLSNEELLVLGQERDKLTFSSNQLAVSLQEINAKGLALNKSLIDQKTALINKNTELQKSDIKSTKGYYDEKGEVTKAGTKLIMEAELAGLEAKYLLYSELDKLSDIDLKNAGFKRDDIKALLSTLKEGISNIKNELGKETDKKDNKINLAKLFGFDDEDQDAVNAAFAKIGESLLTIYNELIDGQINKNDELLNRLDKAIATSQERLQKQLELSKQGFANNYLEEKKNIDKINEERKKAVAKRRELEKQKIALDSISQVSSLITASANIYESLSAIPGGIALATISIGLMFAAFIAQKAAAAKLVNDKEYFTGGYTGDGDKHNRAGIVHKREFVSTEKVTTENRDLLEGLHTSNMFLLAKGINNLISKNKIPIGGIADSLRLPKPYLLTEDTEKDSEHIMLLKKIADNTKLSADSNERIAASSDGIDKNTKDKFIPLDNGYKVISKNSENTVYFD